MAHFITVPMADVAFFKQWTTSGGSVHYSLLDEGIPNKNTSDYVTTGLAAKQDRYDIGTGPEYTDNVDTVHIYMYLKGLYQSVYPGLTIKLYIFTTEIATHNYLVDTGGSWALCRFDFTGLDISGDDFPELRMGITAFEAIGTEDVPVIE